jgi:hypothetical protein
VTRKHLISLIIVAILVIAGIGVVFIEVRNQYEINARITYKVGDFVTYRLNGTAEPEVVMKEEIIAINKTTSSEILAIRVSYDGNNPYNNTPYIFNASRDQCPGFNDNPLRADPMYRIVGLETLDTKWGPKTVVHYLLNYGDDKHEFWLFHGMTLKWKFTYMDPINLQASMRTIIDSNIQELTG